MELIRISELNPHPRNEEFFDNISGESWTAFLESIKTSGVIEPVVITPEKVIISGHQRVRACKELGIDTVLTDMRSYDDEDKILKDLIETNIRQRGIGNPNPVKLGRCIKELERIYGIREGRPEKLPKSSVDNFTQQDLAKMIGISVDTLQNYKTLAEMIPELEELVDTGIVTKTTALAIMKELTADEQEDLIANLDVTKKITKKSVQSLVDEIKELREHPPLPDDYEEIKSELKTKSSLLKEYKADNERISGEYKTQVEENKKLNSKIEELENEKQNEYMKKICDSCLTFNARIATFIEEVGGYIWLADKINEMPEIERKGYLLSVQRIKDWADTLEYNINKNKGDIIL